MWLSTGTTKNKGGEGGWPRAGASAPDFPFLEKKRKDKIFGSLEGGEKYIEVVWRVRENGNLLLRKTKT